MRQDRVTYRCRKSDSVSDSVEESTDNPWGPQRRRQAFKQAHKSVVHAAQQSRVLLRSCRADEITHQYPEIEPGDVYDQSLEDVRVMSKLRSSHASAFKVVRKWPFQKFAALPQ